MYLVAAVKSIKKAGLVILIVAYGFGLLLLNGCKDPLDLVKQQLAETKQQPFIAVSNPDSAPETATANPTLTTSNSNPVIENNTELSSVSSNNTGAAYQGSIYQASALPSPFRLPNFIDPITQTSSIEDQYRNRSNLPNKKPDQLLNKFQYRGRIVGVGEATYGLIQRPDGIIIKVKVGQNVAQKPIRVIEITPTQINLVEQGGSPEIGVSAKRLTLIAPVAP